MKYYANVIAIEGDGIVSAVNYYYFYWDWDYALSGDSYDLSICIIVLYYISEIYDIHLIIFRNIEDIGHNEYEIYKYIDNCLYCIFKKDIITKIWDKFKK